MKDTTGMTQQHDHMEQELPLDMGPEPFAETPIYASERVLFEDYRTGPYWRVKEGEETVYLAIADMEDEHVLRARAMTLRKCDETTRQIEALQRRMETLLIKYQQLNREAKSRGILNHQHERQEVKV